MQALFDFIRANPWLLAGVGLPCVCIFIIEFFELRKKYPDLDWDS